MQVGEVWLHNAGGTVSRWKVQSENGNDRVTLVLLWRTPGQGVQSGETIDYDASYKTMDYWTREKAVKASNGDVWFPLVLS